MRWRALPGVACAAVGFGACAVGPDFVRPEPPKETRYTRQETSKRLAVGADIPVKWWRLFHAAKLDPIVDRAVQGNQTLAVAQATLRQSQRELQAGKGVFYPQIGVDFNGQRMKSAPQTFGAAAPSSVFNLFSLSGTVSYALDVFGGNRRNVEGLAAQAEAQDYQTLATYITLTSNVVNAAIARAAYDAEAEATREMVRFQSEQVEVVRSQVRAQTVPYLNLVSVESQLSAFQASLPPLEQSRDQTDHLIATLSGVFPVALEPQAIPLKDFSLPGSLPLTLPSELVRRRPDILAAEARLHAASAAVGVATAALFPSFSLNGTFGWNHVNGEFFSGTNSVWNFGGGITAPIFQGGALRARKGAAEEAFQASLATYRQTVLDAFRQVADILRAIEHDTESVRAQTAALAYAEEARRLTAAGYRAGTASYLQLLTASTQYAQAKIGHLQATAQQLQNAVALFTALGGGWWNLEPVSAKEPPRAE